MISLDGFDLETPCQRRIDEYSFYATRLQKIDFKQIITLNKKFEDPHFKADITSLFDDSIARRPEIESWTKFQWKRPSEIYGKTNFCIFDKIDPNDIKQGSCGDCYFLSSLSSLAEVSDRIKRVFITEDVNDAGCYAVQIYINGEKQTVVVDDRFPYNPQSKTWAFSRTSEGREIWPLILEKAWAKVFGNY